MIFNEAMLDRIDADLASAIQGDRGARQRVYQKHMKWLLHYARYTNEQMRVAMAEYDMFEEGYNFNPALEEDSVAAPGSPTALAEDAAIAAAEAEGENETPENPVEDASDESEETPETAEAEEGSSEETPEADEAE